MAGEKSQLANHVGKSIRPGQASLGSQVRSALMRAFDDWEGDRQGLLPVSTAIANAMQDSAYLQMRWR